MADLVTAEEMRILEKAAIDSGEVTGLELMERAGRGVMEAMVARWPERGGAHRRAAILCGPGNNGGDGFVVARLLQARGWRVQVFFHGDPARLPPDARANHARWDGPVSALAAAGLHATARASREEGQAELPVVDALFGIGQRAPLDDVLAPVNAFLDRIAAGNDAARPLFVNVDIPTGYDADTGAALAARPVPSDLIVTFHCPKPIHRMPQMMDADLHVVDIGL